MSNKDNLIRGGQFIVRETDAKDVFTPEDFTEEQRMMRDSVKEFIDKEDIPKKHQFEKKDYALTEDVMRKAVKLGLLGIAVPEEYDGMGMIFVITMMICDYIAGRNRSIATE